MVIVSKGIITSYNMYDMFYDTFKSDIDLYLENHIYQYMNRKNHLYNSEKYTSSFVRYTDIFFKFKKWKLQQ